MTVEALVFWALVLMAALYFVQIVISFRDQLGAFFAVIFCILTACVPSLEFSRSAALGFAMLLSLLAYSIYASRRRHDRGEA
jgi:uncharacterized membrane protein YagU involved in acid resistance